jgi:hypothetical protein
MKRKNGKEKNKIRKEEMKTKCKRVPVERNNNDNTCKHGRSQDF